MDKVAKIASGTAGSMSVLTDAATMFGAIRDVAGSDLLKAILPAVTFSGASLAFGPASAFVLGAAGLSGAVALYKASVARKENVRQEQCHEWTKAANEKLNALLLNDRDFKRAAEAMASAEAGGTYENLVPEAYGNAAPQIVQFQALLRMRDGQREAFDRMVIRFDTLEGDVDLLTKCAEETLRVTKAIREEQKKQGAQLERQDGKLDDISEQMRRLIEMASARNDAGSRELTPAEKIENAYAELAQGEGVPVEELKKAVRSYAESVRKDPKADPMEKARAEYVAANYLNAAKEAGDVANAGLAQMRKQKAEFDNTRAKVREALILRGQSLYAARQFSATCEAYKEALENTSRQEDAPIWAKLQLALGDASNSWAITSEGANIASGLTQAILAYRAALDVFTPKTLPLDRAMTHRNLGNALRNLAAVTGDGSDHARLLGEAVTAYKTALEVFTPDEQPLEWARMQIDYGLALINQSYSREGTDRAKLLDEAVAMFRAALKVFTPDERPLDRAATQQNLGNALRDQALMSKGDMRAQLLGEAVAAYRTMLDVCPRDEQPLQWAGTQHNLGNALIDQALANKGIDRSRLWGEAVAAYRAALEVFTSEHLHSYWAQTSHNITIALVNLALDHLASNRFEAAEAIFRDNSKLAVPGQLTFLGECLAAVRILLANGFANPLLARAERLLVDLGA